ncbi:putative phosphatidylinositol N-acetylglucosaminyltransferase subunit C [Cercospora beticola]|nr:putative phosphatidylinositol N-acetylglucosaminyltransferase subunit C [Cercospora beticola]PIB01341.1 putative phosphatidylinositol N-acetylglucosaminyltransferase subunit C [Cercospora beticola]
MSQHHQLHPLTTISHQSSRNSSVHSAFRRRSEQHLRPDDAFYHSPPRNNSSSLLRTDTITSRMSQSQLHSGQQRSSREKRRGRSSSRRRAALTPKPPSNGQWKKLLWVKQSYPDNYTDEETFLDHLQMNPKLRPYEFWPLVADSTIIVQHVCSVLIFVCCFAAIFSGRVKPESVVGWATGCTVIAWGFRDKWQGRSKHSDEDDGEEGSAGGIDGDDEKSSRGSEEYSADYGKPFKEISEIPITAAVPSRIHSRNPSTTSIALNGGMSSSASPSSPTSDALPAPPSIPSYIPPYNSRKTSMLSPRMQERLTTAKSAILIYCSLLGLSPILKSLTQSTSSDSIWALSSWLLILNIFTFDYGAGPEAKFPASLSTNAALMASTVLASRLPSTTHVFSLTLFSIEVFGLFPVFRRHLRHHSWTGHVWLTVFLVVLASGGLGMTISGGGWGWGALGVVMGTVIMGLGMGLTSWWLIGLQRYKNEIYGPWDPARPILGGRRGWS